MKYIIISVFLFLLQYLTAIYFLKKPLNIALGSIFLASLALFHYLSIKLSFAGRRPVIVTLLLVLKIPFSILFLFIAFKNPEFHSISFLIGVLILLPCLLTLSYRNL